MRLPLLRIASKPNGISPSGFSHGFLLGFLRGSVDPIDDRAIDDKSHRPQWAVVQAREESFCLEISDVNRIGQARAIAALDCSGSPFRREHSPQRAVIKIDRRNAAENIERSATVGQRAVQSLSLRIVATGGAVGKDVNALRRFSRRSIFQSKWNVLQSRRVSRALEGGDEGIVCFG